MPFRKEPWEIRYARECGVDLEGEALAEWFHCER
jgi:hypothetical protein